MTQIKSRAHSNLDIALCKMRTDPEVPASRDILPVCLRSLCGGPPCKLGVSRGIGRRPGEAQRSPAERAAGGAGRRPRAVVTSSHCWGFTVGFQSPPNHLQV